MKLRRQNQEQEQLHLRIRREHVEAERIKQEKNQRRAEHQLQELRRSASDP